MKIQNHPAAIKLIEKFDNQLKDILAEELRLVRSAESKLIQQLTPDTNGSALSLLRTQA